MEFTKTTIFRGGGPVPAYLTYLTSRTGRKMRVVVRKESVMNPSARGGAYKDQWVASHATYKGHGDTRADAVHRLEAGFIARGTIVKEK